MSTYTEEISVAGGKLKETLKSILREGNVRRIVIQNGAGRTLLDVPLAAGVVGVALAPFWLAVGGIAALAADFKIKVVRDVIGPPATVPNDRPPTA
jgi:Domain of unknown function (DUF4342)